MSAYEEGALTVKVLLVGDSATGAKTCLLDRFTKGTFTLFTYPTLGAVFDTQTLEVDGIQVKLGGLGFASGVSYLRKHTTFVTTHAHTDTAVHDRYLSLKPLHCRGANAIVFGFDVTDRRSFDGCDRWIDELREHLNQDCVRVAVGNKIDLYDQRDISTEEAREHFESMEPPVPYFETSAKTGKGVNELFDSVARLVIKHHIEVTNNKNTDENLAEEGKCIIC